LWTPALERLTSASVENGVSKVSRQTLKNRKGGEKASRKYPKCHSKKIQKNGISEKGQLNRKPISWRKHLSLGSVFILQGISERLKNRLKMGTSGDITTIEEFKYAPLDYPIRA